ncbi:hypothetical protein CB0940_06438 [Cercospora beticola]|uniref:Protein HRI1 n=1 Tax=Cercospora beticola TaxID=122368 RepID=A0A2G5HZQ9_CERBT|nr:hypothetical protein CB0940_06438 [Cercospora beticola]PIA98029.1 hypothetical protein CB0940_06438 [Cercospora beticola]WPA99074.1 hypothetical protein RHO25_003689 [Cercospora beticola]
MPQHISVRDFIRFPATSDPKEPTSTLVLTSSGNRFVDIRILKEGPEPIPQVAKDAALLPLSHLDWAFAGTSSSNENVNGEVKSVWTHWIDSRTLQPETVNDSGVMDPQSDGRTLERGVMPDPETGKLVRYEEMWRDIEASSCGEKNAASGVKCVVLQMYCETGGEEKDRARGMVIRLGQFCQGVVRVGEAFALERWAWKEGEEKVGGGWKREVRMGDLFLPCGVAMEHFERLKVGGKVTYEGFEWSVVELEERG